jgi:hypothetical protein
MNGRVDPRIEELRVRNLGSLELAEVVSLAAIVEPRLLREARLRILPHLDAGAEGDLWLSSLVQSRSPDGIVFPPEIAELLRQGLAQHRERRRAAWLLVRKAHRHLSPALRLEEEINALSVYPTNRALRRIEKLLTGAFNALIGDESRNGLASWGARVITRLPEAIRRLEPARLLAMAAYLRLGGRFPELADEASGAMPDWISWALPKNVPRATLGVSLVSEGVEIGPPQTCQHSFEIPATDPLVVEISWAVEDERRHCVIIRIEVGERILVEVPLADVSEIRLRTLLGERFRLQAASGKQPSRFDMRPLCFVLIPFGRKPDPAGVLVDFDAVYQDLIRPAIDTAGMEAIRADEGITGGLIHKPMFERLILCEYAVADLTTANANIYYQLGIRHAVRPSATLLLFAGQSPLPFDPALLRALPYKISPAGQPDDLESTRAKVADLLRDINQGVDKGTYIDSPVYQLVEGFPDITDRLKSMKIDAFRDRVQYSAEIKARLASARKQDVNAIREIEKELEPIEQQESGTVVDLLLSYRAIKAWDEMIALVEKMPRRLAETVLIREQLALALNRAGKGVHAEEILLDLIKSHGESSETCGILGRVYKDRWEAAKKVGNVVLARGLLDRAIDAYLKGFEADWRDAYPGINAITLMTLRTPPDRRKDELVPVVTYAVKRRIASGKPDYWDFATLLELAVIGEDEAAAEDALGNALSAIREVWEPETTVRNLRLIREARESRGAAKPWFLQIESELSNRAMAPAE